MKQNSDFDCEYTNGYIERKHDGTYCGSLRIDGIDISPIVAVAFNKEDGKYIWLRRRDILVYDHKNGKYVTKKREPQWESYIKKQMDGNTVSYRGEFHFLMFKYSIVGVWDKVLGRDKSRLNLYVERLDDDKQDIIHGIRKRVETE